MADATNATCIHVRWLPTSYTPEVVSTWVKWVALLGSSVALVACFRREPRPTIIAVHAAPTSSYRSSAPPPPTYDPSTATATSEPSGATANPAARATAGDPTTAAAVGPAPTGTASLPETASRDDVLQAVHGVQAQTRACGRGQPQTIMVQLTFSGSGELTSAEPQESARGSAEASCLVAALRAARTQPFRAPSLQMWVPFSLE